jgi:hypothetical protein
MIAPNSMKFAYPYRKGRNGPAHTGAAVADRHRRPDG